MFEASRLKSNAMREDFPRADGQRMLAVQLYAQLQRGQCGAGAVDGRYGDRCSRAVIHQNAGAGEVDRYLGGNVIALWDLPSAEDFAQAHERCKIHGGLCRQRFDQRTVGLFQFEGNEVSPYS